MKDMVNCILVDFNILFETDMGAALYVYTQSSNKEYFEDYMREATYEFFMFKALTRTEENPIRYLFKSEYKNSADSIYEDLKKTKWDKVLKYSPITDIMASFSLAASRYGILTQVNCKNQAEVDRLKKEVSWEGFIDLKDISHYNSIYLHSINSLKELDVTGKIVYLYDYALNFLSGDMKEKAINLIAVPFGGVTEFKIISPFKDFQLPEGYRGTIPKLKTREEIHHG